MKYLKGINESKSSSNNLLNSLENLKDALTEITDSRKVLFYPNEDENEIEIIIKLNNYKSLVNDGLNYDLSKVDDSKKSISEIFEMIDLVKEGFERSQIDYSATESKFIIDDNGYINWDEDENDDNGEECNILTFIIKLK